MSLDRLLSQFDALAEHGTNIARIRKLLIINVIKRSISRDGFLQRAATAKAQIALTSKNSGGKISKTRNQDLALPDVLLKIPAEAFGRLGDIAEIEKGLTAIQKSKPGPYPLVVTAETRSSNETFDFEGPAVVIPMVSSTGHGHASLKRIHYQEGKFAAGNILSVVKPKLPELLNTRFLYEYLTAFKEELLVARMVGTANVSLTINGLRDIPVPLIQGEDVAKVDELMALCDRLEVQLKERDVKQAALAKAALSKFTEDPTPENLQQLFHPSFSIETEDMRDTVLSLAMQGKLVSQKSGSAHADNILNKLATINSSSKTKRTAGSYTFSRYDIPENWRWCELGDLATLVTSGSRDWASYYSDSGAIFVRMGNLSRNSYQLRLRNIQHVKPPQKTEGDRTKLMAGDLLISIDYTKNFGIGISQNTFARRQQGAASTSLSVE
jgi:type I restriction enzyme S subunit